MRWTVAWASAIAATMWWVGTNAVLAQASSVLELVDQTAGVTYAAASEDPSRAYIGAGRRAYVVDLAPDGRTTVRGRTSILPAIVRSLAIHGARLYVAPEGKEIFVFDVSDPTAPREVGVIPSTHEGRDIVVHNDRLYVAEFGDGLNIYDISAGVPDAPLAVERTWRGIVGFTIQGDLLYAAYATEGIGIIDISNPAEPRALGLGKLPSGKAAGIAVSGTAAYLVAEALLAVYDVSDPSAPRFVTSSPSLDTLRFAASSGTALYLGAGGAGVTVYDITDPLNPRLTTVLPTPSEIIKLRVTGERLYAIDWLAGVTVYDIAQPGRPTRVAEVSELTGFGRGIAQAGGLIYAGYSQRRIDVLDGATLQRVGGAPLDGGAQDLYVDVAGDRLAVGEWETGLWLFDLVDPRTPRLMARDTARVRDLQLLDASRVVATAGRMGMSFWDAADPSKPKRVARTGTYAYMWGLAADDDNVFVANRESGLDIYSTVPEGVWPVVGHVGFQDVAGEARDVILLDTNTAAVAAEHGGLILVDVTDRTSPSVVSRVETRFRPIVVGTLNGLVVAGGRSYGLAVYDVRDVARPRYVGFQPLSWAVHGFAAIGDTLYVAAAGEGILAFRIGTIPAVGTEVREDGPLGPDVLATPQTTLPEDEDAIPQRTVVPRDWRLWVSVLGGIALAILVATVGRFVWNRRSPTSSS